MGCHLQTESHQAPDVVSKHNYALDTRYFEHWQPPPLLLLSALLPLPGTNFCLSPSLFLFESKMALARSKCARSRFRSPKYASIAGYNLAKHLLVILLL